MPGVTTELKLLSISFTNPENVIIITTKMSTLMFRVMMNFKFVINQPKRHWVDAVGINLSH